MRPLQANVYLMTVIHCRDLVTGDKNFLSCIIRTIPDSLGMKPAKHKNRLCCANVTISYSEIRFSCWSDTIVGVKIHYVLMDGNSNSTLTDHLMVVIAINMKCMMAAGHTIDPDLSMSMSHFHC